MPETPFKTALILHQAFQPLCMLGYLLFITAWGGGSGYGKVLPLCSSLLIEATVKTGGRFRAQQQYPTDLCRIANKGGRILRRPIKIQGLPAPIVKEHSLPSSHIKS